MPVPDHRDIPNVFSRIDFHLGLLRQTRGMEGLKRGLGQVQASPRTLQKPRMLTRGKRGSQLGAGSLNLEETVAEKNVKIPSLLRTQRERRVGHPGSCSP